MQIETNNKPNREKLNPVERYLLRHGYDPEEVDAIEELIMAGIEVESEVLYMEADRASRVCPEIMAVWETEGVLGVIRDFREFIAQVEHFFPTYRSWEQIQYAFADARLTPLPGQSEIEDACGPGGLALPCVRIDDVLYFDFKFVGASDEAKAERVGELAQARYEVLRYLVGKS